MSIQTDDEMKRALWNIANGARFGMASWDCRQYLLSLLFYRHISESLENFVAQRWGLASYAECSDRQAARLRESIVAEKGFVLLPHQLFRRVFADRDSPRLCSRLSDICWIIERSGADISPNSAFRGLFNDLDFDSSKLGATAAMRHRALARLMEAIEGPEFDSLVDFVGGSFYKVWESLLGLYAENIGKLGGESFTPPKVSELLMRLAVCGKMYAGKVYDLACGSGELLLKAAEVLGKDAVWGFYGQEINATTFNFCRLNMLIHDVNHQDFVIANGDTLVDPQLEDFGPFDTIVSQPPWSIRWDGESNAALVADPRFAPAGVLAPKSKADLAFVMHAVSWLAPQGTAALVCTQGVLCRGGAEQKIRQYLVGNDFIDAVVQLPENLFYGTAISACILLLKKGRTNDDVLFVDASHEGSKDGSRNTLSDLSISEIVKLYASRTDARYKCKSVSREVIAERGYDLGVSSYVESDLEREKRERDADNRAEVERLAARLGIAPEQRETFVEQVRSVAEHAPLRESGEIFISYARADLEVVKPMVETLRESTGIDPWIDLEGIETGAQFEDKIIDAIDRCKVFVFMMSKNSMESPWTRREFDYAMNMGKKVCPVRIDDSRPARWFLFKYGGLDCVDYADSAQREKMFRDLVAWTRSAKDGVPG